MRLIDSHCHLDLSAFDSDREAVLQRAQDEGVTDVIVPAVQASGWKKLQGIVAKESSVSVHPAYGLHPVFEQYHGSNDLLLLEKQLSDEATIAVGECGLDFFIDEHDKTQQLLFFTDQLDLAVQHQLPVIIHSRKSLDLVLKELRLRPSLTGVIHSYSGSYQQAKQLIDLGFYLGFGGPITYPRARKLRGLVADLPLESLLLETDAPDQPDISNHGLRNEPSWLSNIAGNVAELRNIPSEKVAEITTKNCERLFRL
jgi:TatD DNase family protein